MRLVVFSHGLAGTRNMYAALASALASQGYLVAAVEHRDGSASYTAIHGKHGVTHKPYVHTDGNFAWRLEQIGKRVAELDAAVAALSTDAPPRNAYPGSRFDVSAFDGLVDASCLVAMGHSFGGATVVAAAGGRPDATRIKKAVLLDPWTAPFGPCGADDARHPLRAAAAAKIPTLVVNSHGWGADLTPMYSHATAPWVEAEVEGTKHQDFSDLGIRMPTVAAKIGMKGSVDAARFFDLKLGLIDAFLESADRADADEACASALGAPRTLCFSTWDCRGQAGLPRQGWVDPFGGQRNSGLRGPVVPTLSRGGGSRTRTPRGDNKGCSSRPLCGGS